jgi:hypothetical protein
VQAHQLDGAAAARKAHVIHDLGDSADAGELALVARDKEHALLVTHVDRERGTHIWEDDDVVEGDEKKISHRFTFGSYLRSVRKYRA